MAVDRRTRRERKLELYKLVVARSDVTEALETATHLLQVRPKLTEPRSIALQNAMVVAYARPFSQTRGGYGPLPSSWARFSNERLRRTHEALLRDRDRLKAHSDPRERIVQIIPHGTVVGGRRVEMTSVAVRNVLYAEGIIRNVRDTALDLGSRLNKAVEERIDALFGAVPYGAAPFDLSAEDDS